MIELRAIQGPLEQRLLAALEQDPWSSATTIANRLHAKPSTVSSLLYRMCQRKIAVRQKHSNKQGPGGGWAYALPEALDNDGFPRRRVHIDKGPWTDTLVGQSCTVMFFDRRSDCYRMQYARGGRLWAASEQFGPGRRFTRTRHDLILDAIE